MIMGSMMTAFSEGLALADAAGLPQSEVLEVVKLGAITCPMYTLKVRAWLACMRGLARAWLPG